jgi:transcriptional regulator with XRE-family HTH domain
MGRSIHLFGKIVLSPRLQAGSAGRQPTPRLEKCSLAALRFGDNYGQQGKPAHQHGKPHLRQPLFHFLQAEASELAQFVARDRALAHRAAVLNFLRKANGPRKHHFPFPERAAGVRRLLKLSQAHLARLAGISQPTLSAFELGDVDVSSHDGEAEARAFPRRFRCRTGSQWGALDEARDKVLGKLKALATEKVPDKAFQWWAPSGGT